MTTTKSLTCFAVNKGERRGVSFFFAAVLPFDGDAIFGGGVTGVAMAFFFGGEVAAFADFLDVEGWSFLTTFFAFFLGGGPDTLADFFVLAGVRFETATCFFLE